MTNSPLSVAFLWHMHQPYYRDPMSGVYRLPWVRLHGTKDYLDMVEVLKDFPAIRQNFNLVPSLLEQIIDYTDNSGRDAFLDVSRKRASDLDDGDKQFMLENFFLANWEYMVKPFPRYYELLLKRGVHLAKGDTRPAAAAFAERDFRDLQVLFNLCWVDPRFRERDPFLKKLVAKGGNFSEEDKETLLTGQIEIMRKIIPTYREMAAAGSVELSCSPFYHPILPLLCDTDAALPGMPSVPLPRSRFRHPEDAEHQMRTGLDYFEKVFGFRPAGMWPSEGSVSEEVLRIASGLGLRWVATDEGVLARSVNRTFRDGMGNLTDPAGLCRPYRFGDVSIIFRDHALSDLIGFVYSQWEPKAAAEDLIRRLVDLRNGLPGDGPYLASIILDGENAWEHYRNDGQDFFRYLYEGLSREERLRTVLISDFLREDTRGDSLEHVFPASWINSNFGIWIGHEEDNRAWDSLSETRDRLAEFQANNPGANTEEAWKSIYIAEGSDWNWWYGDDHTTETQDDFDELFRLNLVKVYREIGLEAPPYLFEPIAQYDREVPPALAIRGFIDPKIDGTVTSYYEWYQGGRLDVKVSGGSMHRSESLIDKVYYGFNAERLFLRMDLKVPIDDLGQDAEFAVMTAAPSLLRISCMLKDKAGAGTLSVQEDEAWRTVGNSGEWAVNDIFEFGVPFADLKAKVDEEIHLYVSIRKAGEEIERCPWRGYITLKVPTKDFEAMMWY